MGENTVDFPPEKVVGKVKDSTACPESASPQLSFVFCREHQNESHVFFRTSNVLEVPNSKAVPNFFQQVSDVHKTLSLVTFGISGRSNRNALFRNSNICF